MMPSVSPQLTTAGAQRENSRGADATLSQAAKIPQASGEGRG
jgi:hypothetical protein